MGLLKAIGGAVGGTLGDQWKEFIYCESMPLDVLMRKGQKRNSSMGRSSNTSAEDNVISNGSGIAVNEGQCMIIVENGEIVDICAEPGQYTYKTDLEPSVMAGDLSNSVMSVFKQIGKRFTYGGDPGKDQRVYFINTKEILGNKYGTPSPVPFKIVDKDLGLKGLTIHLRCFGEYSYRITNPLLFYTSLAGNVPDEYLRSTIDSQMKSELLDSLNPAFGRISAMGIGYDEIVAHTSDLKDSMNEVLDKKWGELRGIELISVTVNNVHIGDEDKAKLERLQDLQLNAALRDPGLAAAHLAGAQAEAMQKAASNEGGMGAMGAFMGMNMAGAAGGINAQALYGMQAQQQQQMAAQQAAQAQAAQAGGWTCACGTHNTGKFCANCGKPQPAPAGAWQCECGTQNTGKFCQNCGKPQPAPAGAWTCECGTQNTGKFCQNCGKPNMNGPWKCECGKENEGKFCANCGKPRA